MKQSCKNQMTKRIASLPAGSVFMVSDFTDLMDYTNAKKNIARLETSGYLRRIIRGVYDHPKYIEILGEYAAPDINQVALAIARNYHWTIAPAGNTSLNLLGLSSQVPADFCYVSTGPYRSFQIGHSTLQFMHRSNKSIEGMSWKSAMVIQALKAIGKDNIDVRIITHLKNQLADEDKEVILHEARQTTAWIYTVIKEICIKTE